MDASGAPEFVALNRFLDAHHPQLPASKEFSNLSSQILKCAGSSSRQTGLDCNPFLERLCSNPPKIHPLISADTPKNFTVVAKNTVWKRQTDSVFFHTFAHLTFCIT